MSYKIAICATAHTNFIGFAMLTPAPPHSLTMAPTHIGPEKMPDPWQLDSEALLGELARIRQLAQRIPLISNELIGPTNSVIDAVWDLEERLRFCLHLHCEKERQFRTQAAAALSNNQTKPSHRQAAARPANARRRA